MGKARVYHDHGNFPEETEKFIQRPQISTADACLAQQIRTNCGFLAPFPGLKRLI